MKKLCVLVLSFFILQFCFIGAIKNINLTAQTNADNFYETENNEDEFTKENSFVNVYVSDESKDFDYKIDDDNFYFIASNKKMSDEEVLDSVEELNNLEDKLNENFSRINNIFDEFKQIEKFFYSIDRV